MKLCIIDTAPGDALAQGWATLQPEYADVEVTVLAVTADQAAAARIDGTDLLLGPDSAALRVPVGSCDAVALHGMGPGAATLIDWMQTHGIAGELPDRPQIVSPEMIQRTWDARLAASALPGVLGLLRKLTDKPIFLLADPLPPESLSEGGDAFARHLTALCDKGDGPYLRDLVDRLMAAHLPGATFLLHQPLETTVAMVLTRQTFIAAPAPDGAAPAALTPACGAIVLGQMLDALGAAPYLRSTMTEPTE